MFQQTTDQLKRFKPQKPLFNFFPFFEPLSLLFAFSTPPPPSFPINTASHTAPNTPTPAADQPPLLQHRSTTNESKYARHDDAGDGPTTTPTPFSSLLLPEFFAAEVLSKLDSVDLALLSRVNHAAREAVKHSGRPRMGGSAEGPRVDIRRFVGGSVSLFAWAAAKGGSNLWEKNSTCVAAAECGNMEVLRWLREHDCPLHMEVYTAAQNGHVNVVDLLIAAGANVNATRPGDGATPLYIACGRGNVVMVERLIAAGADVNMARVDGFTPLHKAAQQGHTGVVSVLLETPGVDLNAAPVDGTFALFTPLFLAAHDNRLDVVKLLIAAGADVNKARAIGWTPLHIAAQIGHAGVVSMLIETPGVDPNAAPADGGDAGITPLFIAAQNNRLYVVALLIDAGADVNMAGVGDGCTPLHMAAHRGHAGVVDLLITAGANVHATRTDGCTPLHMAAQNGHAGVVDLFIAAGANVHATTTDGATALSFALARGHAEVVQKLRAAGSN
jgi:ankyrin repeat protein